MKMKLGIEGVADLERALGELSKATARNTLRKVLLKAGQPIADEAIRLAPDDPRTSAPDLKTSIAVSAKLRNEVGKAAFAAAMAGGKSKGEAAGAMRAARREAGAEGSFAEVYVGPGKGGGHGVLQEFGTVHHPPQPFMRPAWDQEQGAALNIIKTELAGAIDKAVVRARRRAAKKAAK